MRAGASIVLILLVLAPAFAFGVSPARKAHDYQPTISGEITLVNNQKRSLDLYLAPRGGLAEYVQLTPASLVMEPDEMERTVRYTVEVPEGMLGPGRYRVDIVALTFQPDTGSATVSATAGVSSQIFIEVPYDGAHLETRLDYSRANQRVVIPLFNKGTDPTRASITLSMLGPTNEVLHTLRRTNIEVESHGFTEEVFELPEVNPGSYLLKSRVEHDGRIILRERVIEVGTPRLALFDYELSLSGRIVKLDLPVESHWNERIENAYAIHDISTPSGTFLERIKTPSTEIEPFSHATLTSYWESPGEGDYRISTLVSYDGETQTSEELISVTPTGVQTIGQTGRVTSEGTSGWLIFGVVMLVIVNLVLIATVLRRRR